MKQITTIVPTYRRPVLLKRAVLSVLNQSSPDFVVSILDNASGDETESVARELMRMDARVEYHRHPENIGSLQNMIYGMEHVTTPYFSILCDDDLLMPDFIKAGLDGHARAREPLAFVATRVVAVDEAGRFQDPFAHPREACQLSPPDGMLRCIMKGVSLPGVVYRTSAIQAIGAPRVAWWNWTESGWHALAAIKAPIEFSPTVGAIVFVHAGSGSKRMDALEFKISWFRMLSEVRGEALRSAVAESWWNARVLPVAYPRFWSTLFRMSGPNGQGIATTYEAFGESGVAAGLNPGVVSASIALARATRALGLGQPLNGALDWLQKFRSAPDHAPSSISIDEPPGAGIGAAAEVFSALNRQAGLN